MLPPSPISSGPAGASSPAPGPAGAPSAGPPSAGARSVGPRSVGPHEVDLSAAEDADPAADLPILMTASADGTVELHADSVRLRGGVRVSVTDPALGAMWIIVVTLASLVTVPVSIAIVIRIIPAYGLTVAVICGVMAFVLELGVLYLAWWGTRHRWPSRSG